MSMIYDGGVRDGRISLNRFVELTSTIAGEDLRTVPEEGHDRGRLATPTS